MTADTNLERRIAEHYAGEPPLRAPDRVLLGALATIDTTRQRRGIFAPWRYPNMNTFAKAAAALVVAVAVGGIALWQLGSSGQQGSTLTPSPSLEPSAAPTAAATQAPPPTPGSATLGDLTQSFTSDRHGFSMSYPEGWTAKQATAPWTTLSFLNFDAAGADLIYDPARDNGHLFIAAASQPLGDRSFSEWSTELLAALEADDPACTEYEPVVVDGSDGLMGTECVYTIVAKGGRGYFIMFYLSGDEFDLREFDFSGWARDVLTTVRLQPGQAVDPG